MLRPAFQNHRPFITQQLLHYLGSVWFPGSTAEGTGEPPSPWLQFLYSALQEVALVLVSGGYI